MTGHLAGPDVEHACSQLLPCVACPYRGPKVGSRGNPQSLLVFVAEAPGRDELISKLPLVGPSGRLFWGTFDDEELMEEWGLPRRDLLILNSMQCVPPRSKDARKNMAMLIRGGKICRGRLMEQVEEHPRKLIVAMGNQALWSLTGNYSYKITQVRGHLIPSPLAEMGILPVLHPAALLRGTGNYRQFKADIQYAIDLMRGIPPKGPVQTYYLLRDTPEKVRASLRRFMKKPYIFADTETTGLNRFDDSTLILGLAYDPRLVHIFPGYLSPEKALEIGAHPSWLEQQESMIPYLKEFFKKYKGKVVWHNGKFDVSFTRREGCESKVDEDTMLLSYAYDEQGGIHGLEQVSSDLVGAPDYKDMLKPWVPKKSDSYAKVPKDVLCNYLALDVTNTSQIFPILRRSVERDKHLEKLYTKVLIPASELLWNIEHHGICASKFAVERQQKRLQIQIDKAYDDIQVIARRYGYEGEVNPGSPQQMASLLFDHLKMTPPPGTGRSTAKEVLAQLPDHPVLRALKRHRAAKKAKGTYADAILRNIQKDGRIHPEYLLHGTRTGRLAHKILANIPRDRKIRGMYHAAPGYVFVKVDLSQAELRSLAALSGDPNLCDIYRSTDRSIHTEVANQIWGTPGSSKGTRGGGVMWGEEEYMRAKALNFGIVYGRQAPSIAEEFGISDAEAQSYIDAWKNTFPVAWAFIQKCRSAATQGKTMITPFGSKKRHWVVTEKNLVALQNEASNFPHQNIASNINMMAAVKMAPTLRERDCHIVNLVHDEVLTEVPDTPEMIEWATNIIVKTLEYTPIEWGITRVPFKADASVGRRWGIYRSKTKPGSSWDLRFGRGANKPRLVAQDGKLVA